MLCYSQHEHQGLGTQTETITKVQLFPTFYGTL